MRDQTGKNNPFYKHGLSKTKLHGVWFHMIRRCENEKDSGFKTYGKRGIKVCEEWHDFLKFYEWANNNNYSEGLQLDRIDNDGNYEPSNCRFVTSQANNEIGRRTPQFNNTSGFIGINYIKDQDKWCVRIQNKKTRIYLGVYKNLEDAIEARKNKEIELFGEQKTNF